MILVQQLINNTQYAEEEITMSREQVVNTLRQLIEDLDETRIQEDRFTEAN